MIDVISISNNVISIRCEWVCLYSLTCNVCTCVCVFVANDSHSFHFAQGNKTVCAQHIKLADKCNWSNGITEHVTKRKCRFLFPLLRVNESLWMQLRENNIQRAQRASEAAQLHVLNEMKYQQTCHVQRTVFYFIRLVDVSFSLREFLT